MKNKFCSNCYKNKRLKNHYYCRICHNKYQKEYYKLHLESINESIKRRRIEIRKFIIETKNVPCMDCGKKYPYYVMDFDHRDGEKKEFEMSKVANKVRGINTIKREMEKCDIVCANCHRERTFKKRQITNKKMTNTKREQDAKPAASITQLAE